MHKAFDIGEMRPGRLGSSLRPVAMWPVMVDGERVAYIIETERGYRLMVGDILGREHSFRSSVEEEAFAKFTGRPGSERWTAHNTEGEA